MSESKTTKLYCFVDETGQDTKGEMFVVVAILTVSPSELSEILHVAEVSSGKGKVKWHRGRKGKDAYIKQALSSKAMLQVYYQRFMGPELSYELATVRGERDETNPMIRLADAVAGMVRESFEGSEVFGKLKMELEKRGDILEL